MINHSILKQASSENLDSVVKVAGVVRRLYNWFKELSNDEYRDKVINLKNESVAVKSYMKDLSKQLDKLDSSIKDADVSGYEESLIEVKELCQLLYKELESLQSAAQSSVIPIVQENENQSQEKIEKADQTPLATMSIYISDKAKSMFLIAVGKEVADQIEKSPHFFNLFSKSIKDGVITKTHPVKKEGREDQKYITVKFGPFSVPGINYVFTGTVLLNELPGQKLSLMRTISVHYDDLPKTASRKEILQKLSFQDGRVERFTNVLSPVKLAEVLRAGYKAVFGNDPTLQTLGTGWAQAMIESSGRVMNNNIGNITASSGWINSGKPYLLLQTENDKKNGLKEFGPSGEVLTNLKELKFRSYKSPEEGAADYWKLLNKYGNVLSWFGTGDALHSGLALGDKTYYTANRFLYSGAMSKLYNQFIKTVAPQISGIVSNPSPPPGPFPEYKAWKNAPKQKIPDSLVSNIEKNTGYTVKQDDGKTQSVALNGETNVDIGPEHNEEINGFMNYLFATGPLDNIVKKSIQNKLLNKTNILINIKSADYVCGLKFANSFSEFIKNCFDSDVEIYSDNKNIEICSSLIGDEGTVLGAIYSASVPFCDMFCHKFGDNVKIAISTEKSSLKKLSNNIINKNERLFYFRAL